MAFVLKDTIEANLKLSNLDGNGNLVNTGITIIKQLPNGEVVEHLGYFHTLSRNLKLPYNGVLEIFRKHHKKILGKVK